MFNGDFSHLERIRGLQEIEFDPGNRLVKEVGALQLWENRKQSRILSVLGFGTDGLLACLSQFNVR